jgi:hypothetical protein
MGLVRGNIFFADLKKIPTEACKPSGLEKMRTLFGSYGNC